MTVEKDILIPFQAQLLSEQKEVLFTPAGVSMRPFIEGGKDSVVLKSVTAEPQVGDIILASVATPAIFQALSGVAKIIGINIISGGIGKKELSAKATKNSQNIALADADHLSITS